MTGNELHDKMREFEARLMAHEMVLTALADASPQARATIALQIDAFKARSPYWETTDAQNEMIEQLLRRIGSAAA